MAVNNMTAGSIYKQMLRFAIPIFISQLFQQLYNVADSVIVGHYLATSSLAAVGSSGNLIFLFVSFFEGLSLGAGVLISKNYGAGNKIAVKKAVHTTIASGIIAGIILTTAGVLLTPKLLVLMNTDEQFLPEAIEYFRFYFYGAMGLVMYNISRGIMMAVGDSRKPLYYLIFSSILNVLLDFLFIGVLGYGVWSAALATSIAQVISAILCLTNLCRRQDEVHLAISEIKIHKKEFIEIIKLGVPSGVQNSVIGLANVIVLAQVNSFGMIASATFGAYSKTEGFVFLPITSINMAITTFIGQNLGAKQYERAKKGARFGIFTAMLAAAIVGILFVLFKSPIIGIYSQDPEVLALSRIQINTIAPFYIFLALAHSIASVCKGAGRATAPMLIMLGIWCVFRISYILTVMKLFGEIQLIYWAYPITWILSDIIFVTYYLKSDWVHGFEKQKGEKDVQIQ